MNKPKRELRQKRRPPVQQDQIVNHIRQLVIGGQLQPGDRIPNREELTVQFGVSSVTVQRAFHRLLEGGFAVVRPRLGTFVPEFPPHRHHFALIFPGEPTPPVKNWNQFWSVLVRVARAISCPEYRFSVYTGIDKHLNSHDFKLLVHDLAERNLAGIIFSTAPFLVEGTPILTTPGVPRVAFMSATEENAIPAISSEPYQRFVERAVERLAGRNRRRIAVISATVMEMKHLDFLSSAFQRHGLTFHEPWVQGGDLLHPEWTVRLTRLLLSVPPAERPDGIVVVDDNLAEAVVEGVRQAGVHVPEELEIVAHANFPLEKRLPLPAWRLGLDNRSVLLRAIAILQQQQRGEKPAVITHVPWVFEEELANGRSNGRKPLPHSS